jgi:hypothetical protein
MTRTKDKLTPLFSRAAYFGSHMVTLDYWIRIEPVYVYDVVRLHYGAVLSNGERERAIGTMEYGWDKQGITETNYVHP